MKKLLWLIGNELKLLWKTIAIVFAVLTLFLAALFGVISVVVDLTRNLCDNLDDMYDSFELTVYSVSYGNVKDSLGDRLILCYEEGLTSDCTISANGEEFSTSSFVIDTWIDEDGNEFVSAENIEFAFNVRGAVVCLNDAASSAFSAESSVLTSGVWLTGSWQICLGNNLATRLNAQVGDIVTIGDYSFEVVGIYQTSDNSDDLTYKAYFISMDDGYTFESIGVYYDSSMDMYNAYTALSRSGYECELDYWISSYFDNISTITAFLIAAAVVFALTSAVLMCALANICFRHRKAYICQLKMLGCNNAAIFCVYCGMALFALLAASVVASLLALAFNGYFMGLCADIMGMQFTARLYAYIPVAAFFALAILTVAVYLLFSRKTMSATVAQEIRHE